MAHSLANISGAASPGHRQPRVAVAARQRIGALLVLDAPAAFELCKPLAVAGEIGQQDHLARRQNEAQTAVRLAEGAIGRRLEHDTARSAWPQLCRGL